MLVVLWHMEASLNAKTPSMQLDAGNTTELIDALAADIIVWLLAIGSCINASKTRPWDVHRGSRHRGECIDWVGEVHARKSRDKLVSMTSI